MDGKPREVVVLGAGFGGLAFCQEFCSARAHVTLIDRQNHHLFQPLLYQVATAGLSAPEIAQPIRSILTDCSNLTVLMDEVLDLRPASRQVVTSKATLSYDYLVLALGGVTSYFGHPEWEQFAPGLKSLDDAVRIRHNALLAFEKAETETDPERLRQLMTMVIVGGGPTGVELAGAFAELARHVLKADFKRIDPSQARIILIEASPVILSHLPSELAHKAQDQLLRLGVEVRTNTKVKNLSLHRAELDTGEIIHAENILWAAGVAANPLTKKLGVELDRAGRVKVTPDLSLPGHPEIFAVGDMVLIQDQEGRPVPGVSPAAMQMARHAARLIEDDLIHGARADRPPFKYWDKGTMATIGRSAAVAKIKELEFSGFMAWLAWLGVHLIFLVGFRNKVAVLMQWFYSYVNYKRGARIIMGIEAPAPQPSAPAIPPKA